MLEFIKEKKNCWDRLAACELPIFIYGMGDGALKIMAVMEEYRIPVAGFFASDEYVRGHVFEQHKVHSLAEIEGILEEFVIVLAFAAGYPALIRKVTDLSGRHPLLAPDVPVAGEGHFTYEYAVRNADKIQQVYELLADDFSRRVFADVLNFKISGKIEYLNQASSPRADVFRDILPLSGEETYLDLGAYNGDTLTEFLELTGGRHREIFALEPDKKNFRKLIKTAGGREGIHTLPAAAWSHDTVLPFLTRAGRQSALSASPSSVKAGQVPARSVDSILAGKACTLIKMDVEGAEKEALLGAEQTIRSFSPKLMVSLYHRDEDLFELPLLVHQMNPAYRLYIRHQPYIPAWETNLYAVQ